MSKTNKTLLVAIAVVILIITIAVIFNRPASISIGPIEVTLDPATPAEIASVNWEDTIELSESNAGTIHMDVKEGEIIYIRNRLLGGGGRYFDIVATAPSGRADSFTRFKNSESDDVYRWSPKETGKYTLGISTRNGTGPVLVQFSRKYPD